MEFSIRTKLTNVLLDGLNLNNKYFYFGKSYFGRVSNHGILNTYKIDVCGIRRSKCKHKSKSSQLKKEI